MAAAYKVTVPVPPPAANAPMVERQVEQGLAAAAALLPVDPKTKAAEAPAPDGAADEAGKSDSGQSGKGTRSRPPAAAQAAAEKSPRPRRPRWPPLRRPR